MEIRTQNPNMLRFAGIFLLVSLMSAVFAFGSVEGLAAGIARFAFFFSVALAINLFLLGAVMTSKVR